jgi:hypothetical protein
MADTTQTAGSRLLTATQSWLTEPIVGTVDMIDLFLLVGIVLVSMFLWSRVLAHMGE